MTIISRNEQFNFILILIFVFACSMVMEVIAVTRLIFVYVLCP